MRTSGRRSVVVLSLTFVVAGCSGSGVGLVNIDEPVVHVDAVPVIEVIPPSGQRTGLPFTLDGTGSIFDPNAEPTCFEWTITSSIPASDFIIRDPDKAIVSDLLFGAEGETDTEQTLIITLRISDEPDIDCSLGSGADPSDFSPVSDVIAYLIRCDFSAPVVDAGSDVVVSLPGGPNNEVAVALGATGSDLEFPDLSYVWDCGGGLCDPSDCSQQSVTCTYNVQGTFTATVIAENDCGLVALDALTLTVSP